MIKTVIDITVVDKLETGLSDHQLLLWKISSPPSRHLTDASKVRRWRKLDIAGLERCLLSSPLVDSVALPSMDVDQMVELYESTLTAALSTSLPVMAPRLYKYRHPWFDAECMRERCRLTSLRRRNAAREDIRAVARSYTRLLHTKRRHYYTKRIAEVHHPARRWKLVSEATGLGGVTGRSAAPTAETYSAFLNEKLNDICESTEGAPSPKFMSSTSISEFVQFCPAGFDEVQRLISSLPGKQCGLDPIPTWLLKRLSHLLLPYLVHLFNKSLSSGQCPRSFKEAQVRPILKKSTLDPQLPSSYRPISNLSVLSKLLERLVLSRLLTHLNNNALLPKTQSAYRPHHSTETAVLRVVSDIRVALDVGHVSLLLLLDMSAAFDTVDHDILIARMDKAFAVRQTPLQWFRTYLSGRSQTILSSSSCSAKQLIQSGVPQGSVLGSILFSLYVSDIAGIVATHGHSSHQYADDTQIYGHCRPEGVPDLVCRVSTCFREIVSWTSSNRLRLNPDKTEAIWFGSPAGCSRIGSPTLQLTGATIIPSQTVRSLGMYLDSSLTMGPHVGRVAAGCYAKLRVLKEAKPFVPHNIFISLIVQLILSKLDYCNSLLVNASCRNLNTLQAVMNTAARLIYGRRSSDHITPLLMDLHWLRIPDRITFKILLLVYRAATGSAPQYLTELLTSTSAIPGRASLRSSNNRTLVVPRSRTVRQGDRTFYVCGPRIWNSLPTEVRVAPTIEHFKKLLKTYLFSRSS